MLNLITIALQESIAAFERDDMENYAFHAGKAGGVAAAIGSYGIKSLSMCDDISDALRNQQLQPDGDHPR